jgi:hypothetical protein
MGAIVYVIVILIWLVNIYCTVDAARRPPTAWSAADRDKFFWVAMLAAGCFLLVPAFVIMPGYLIGVRPRFADAPIIDDRFRKH